MLPGLTTMGFFDGSQAAGGSGGGGGGGAGVDWEDIDAIGSLPVTGGNSNRTMTAAGTLNFSHNVSGVGFSYNVYLNNVSQGQVSSLAVVIGSNVRFDATKSAGVAGSICEGPFSVTGAEEGGFNIYLERRASEHGGNNSSL